MHTPLNSPRLNLWLSATTNFVAIAILTLVFDKAHSCPANAAGCHEYEHTSQLLSSDYEDGYLKTANKRDIVWIDDKIVINEPIRSNGGDVVLIAKIIEISSLIDTRVEVQSIGPFWRIAPTPRWKEPNLDLMMDLTTQKRGWNAFFDILYSSETYSQEANRFLPLDQRRQASVKNSVKLYSLPSGKVNPGYNCSYYKASKPLEVNTINWTVQRYCVKTYGEKVSGRLVGEDLYPTRGDDAPQDIVDRAATKSGNVYIFAKDISVCVDKDHCDAKVLGDKIKEALGERYPSFSFPVLIRTAGLWGGYGGLGTPYPCLLSWPKRANTRVNCGREGGISGAPGRGGDAGSIQIYQVSDGPSTWLTEERKAVNAKQQCLAFWDDETPKCDLDETLGNLQNDLGSYLSLLSDTEGGFPPYWNSRFKTPSVINLNKEPPFNSFSSVKHEGDDLEALRGDSGTIELGSVNANEAAFLIANRLSAYDVRLRERSYDWEEIRVHPSQFFVSPTRQWEYFLFSTLQRQQLGLLDELLGVGGKVVPRDEAFMALECGPARFDHFPNRQKLLLRSLCDFGLRDDLDYLQSFLTNRGGLYSRLQLDADVSKDRNLILTLLQQIKGVNIQQLDESIRQTDLSFSVVSQSNLETLGKRVQNIGTALNNARIAAEKYKSQSANKFQVFEDFRVAAERGFQAYVAFQSPKRNWVAIGENIYKALEPISPYIEGRRTYAPDFEYLQVELREAEEAYQEYVETISDIRADLVKRKETNLTKLISSAERIRQYQITTALEYDEFLIESLQTLVETGHQDTFRSNIATVQSAIKDIDDGIGSLNLAKSVDECETDDDVTYGSIWWHLKRFSNVRCVWVEADDEKDSILILESDAGFYEMDLPLGVVPNGAGKRRFSLFPGIQTRNLYLKKVAPVL